MPGIPHDVRVPLLVHTVTTWLAGLFIAALALQSGATPSWFQLLTGGAAITAAASFAVAAIPKAVNSPTRRTLLPAASLAATFLAALLIGHSTARDRQSCIAALARQPSLLVAINDRASPTARVTGHASGTGPLTACTVPTSLRIESGTAPPGAIVAVHGTTRQTDRGLLIDGVITPTGASEVLRAWRGRTGETIDTLFRANAPLVRALLIADQRAIAPDVRDRFADAGLIHLLSISGLHVAIIAGALLTLASACRIPKRHATPAALLTVALYVAALGFPPPAVRSTVMLATVAITTLWQRPVHPWTALALGAALPTVQPDVVLDLGWQLSVGGMAALVAARALIRRIRIAEIRSLHSRTLRAALRRFRALNGWRATLARELVTGVVATLVTAPLIAWTFGRVSLIAPLSNIAAGPIVALLQPALFLAIVLAPLHPVAQLVADASTLPITLLDRVARWSAAVPYASLHIAPTLPAACCAGIASASFVRATAARRWTPGIVLAALALTLAIWSPTCTRGPGNFELHLLDVGQGDAIAMRTPHGQWVLVDAGRRWDGGDAGRRVVVPYIQRRGGPVAAFVMSHAHDDHVGGAESVLQALKPAQWWEPAFVTTSSAYRAALAKLKHEHTPWQRVRPGDVMRVDGVSFEVLAPDSSWTAQQHDANETSVVLRVQYGESVFLLTGDAEANEESWLLAHTPADHLRADVLKLGHHGSRTSSTAPFIDAVHPSLGIVSVGQGNRYGHPSPETLGAFAQRNVPVLRTDRDGVIVVSTDGHKITVSSRQDVWTLQKPATIRTACNTWVTPAQTRGNTSLQQTTRPLTTRLTC